jgi:hypothetical protein
MSETNLTQAEADDLIAMEKFKKDNSQWQVPITGGSVSIPLLSSNKRDEFVLDLSRGRIDLVKGKCQNRARQNAVLVRLDFGGQPHRNPDDEEIPCPHLHIYREGYGDKWAQPVPATMFSNTNDRWVLLQDFMAFCNIIDPPQIEKGLFK